MMEADCLWCGPNVGISHFAKECPWLRDGGATKLYVVTITAVYDHGCCGVYTTLTAAESRCRELWEQSDGHHDFRIDVVVADQPIETTAHTPWVYAPGQPLAERSKRLRTNYIEVVNHDS